MSSKLINPRSDRYQSAPYQEEMTFVIPTSHLVETLYSNLLPMVNHDYDIYEMMTLSITVLAVRDEAPAKIAEIATQQHRLAKIRDVHHWNDMDILSKSWLAFTTELFKLYDALNIWDERGCAHFYFRRFLGKDIVVSNKPRLDPREYPTYVYPR